MEIIIRKAEVHDAENILRFLNVVGGETDHLLFGKDDFKHTSVEEEQRTIQTFNSGNHSLMIIALIDGQVIGMASYAGGKRERVKHVVEMAISVSKNYWGQGVATRLMKYLIDDARHKGIEVIHLKVMDDNHSAIRLYEKFGFEKIGYFKNFAKINGQYKHTIMMNLYLNEVEN